MSSGRARRMMEHHLRNRAEGELNLIPMIDILSVLVSFLLVYSTEVEIVQNSKGIEIPESIVTAKPRESVVVMLTTEGMTACTRRVYSVSSAASTCTSLGLMRGPSADVYRSATGSPPANSAASS